MHLRARITLLILAVAALAVAAVTAAGAATSPDVRVSLSDTGNLKVQGSSGADKITLTVSNGRVRVAAPGRSVGARGGCGRIKGGASCPTTSAPRTISILTGAGDDVIQVRAPGSVLVNAGVGNDKIKVLLDLVGKLGATIKAGPGDDVVVGTHGPDRIYGEAGKDEIDGGLGGDRLDGGTEDDLISPGGRAKGAGTIDTVIGGAGRDSVSFFKYTVPIVLSADGVANDGPADDARDTVGTDVERLIGGPLDDVIYGNDQDNSVFGGKGNDKLYGLGGSDNVFDSEGADLLDGGAGSDVVRSEGIQDTAADTVNCGPDGDSATIDYNDTQEQCESVDVKPKPS